MAQPLNQHMAIPVQNRTDHRTNRPTKDVNASLKARQKREMRAAAGMCKQCGKEAVGAGKKNCDNCNRKNQFSTERSIIKKYGLPMPEALRLPSERTGIDYQCIAAGI